MADGNVTLTPEIKHAGDPGFEWQNGYDDRFNGITFARFGGLVFAFGVAGYTDDLPEGDICLIPEDWRDPLGADKIATGKGPEGPTLTLYVSGTGLSINTHPALPDDGFVSFATFWLAPTPAA